MVHNEKSPEQYFLTRLRVVSGLSIDSLFKKVHVSLKVQVGTSSPPQS